jgi:hypothetical protein
VVDIERFHDETAGGSPQLRGVGTVEEQPVEGGGEAAYVVGRDEQAVLAMADEQPVAVTVWGDTGQTTTHGLDERLWVAFGERGQGKDACRGEMGGELGMRDDTEKMGIDTEHGGLCGQWFRQLAATDQVKTRFCAQPRHCFDQAGQVLLCG